MSVWFAYRCHYDFPATKHVKRFDDATLLDWFCNHWRPIADQDEASSYARDLLGCHAHGMGYFMMRMAEEGLAPPTTTAELRNLVEHWSVEGETLFEPHVIQVLDDDDELQMASYFFDDHFLTRHRARAAWLLHEDWRLPATVGAGGFRPGWPAQKQKPRGRWEGTTYLVPFDYEDSGNLDELMPAERIDGVRLPQFARYLAEQQRDRRGKKEDHVWGPQLRSLRDHVLADLPDDPAQVKSFLEAIREHPDDEANWNVFGDWLEDTGRPRAELFVLERTLATVDGILSDSAGRSVRSRQPKDLSQWTVSEHLAQLCLNTSNWDQPLSGSTLPLFAHWVLFDDLWASGNTDLANALLCAANRWDVLSSRRRED
jgi:uncharacterized protein (TIGR02996 family)